MQTEVQVPKRWYLQSTQRHVRMSTRFDFFKKKYFLKFRKNNHLFELLDILGWTGDVCGNRCPNGMFGMKFKINFFRTSF